MNNKVKVVFGEVASRRMEESKNPIKLFNMLYKQNNIDGMVLINEFENEKEKEAYLLGLYQGSGWFDYYILNEEVCSKNYQKDLLGKEK